jgi:hypothetical protein
MTSWMPHSSTSRLSLNAKRETAAKPEYHLREAKISNKKRPWGCVNSVILAGICSILSRFLLFLLAYSGEGASVWEPLPPQPRHPIAPSIRDCLPLRSPSRSGEALFRKAKPCVHPRRKRKTFTQTDIHTKSDA